MKCPKCGTEMKVIQENFFGAVYECPKCGYKTYSSYWSEKEE